jgi:hypothetical protein
MYQSAGKLELSCGPLSAALLRGVPATSLMNSKCSAAGSAVLVATRSNFV